MIFFFNAGSTTWVVQTLPALQQCSWLKHIFDTQCRAVSCHIISVHVCFTAITLVCCNVRYSMGKMHFHRHYGEMQADICPLFAYYNTDNCLSNLWTDSYLHCSIEMVKVLFFSLSTVHCSTPTWSPQNRRAQKMTSHV